MTVSLFNTDKLGMNPTNLDLVSQQLGQGVLAPIFRYGSHTQGDSESFFTYVKMTLAATTNLLPGQVVYFDDDYNATLVATAASPRGTRIGISQVYAPATVAGTYAMWVVRRGQVPVAYTTLTLNQPVETTATAGAINSPAAPTVTTKAITGLHFTKAPATFTGTVTNGSPLITALTGVTQTSGPFVGATITGTGIPASTIIAAINFLGSAVISIQMGTAAGVAVNGTATNAAVVITPSLLGEAMLSFPLIGVTN